MAVPLIIPRQKGGTQLEVKEVTVAGRRYVLCRNEVEARRDAEARAELVAGLERKLVQGDKALVSNKGFRGFLKTPEGNAFVIDSAKVEADARYDGRTTARTEWQRVVDDLADLSEIEVEQDGRRALLRTAPGPTIDAVCRAVGVALPPVFQEMPPAGQPTQPA